MVPMISLLLRPVDRGLVVAILAFRRKRCPVTDKILPQRKGKKKREEGRRKRRETKGGQMAKINGLRQDPRLHIREVLREGSIVLRMRGEKL